MPLRLIVWILLASLAVAAPPRPKKFDPMPVFITERNGTTRMGQLLGQNAFEPREVNPSLHFDTDTGTIEVLVDNLASITEIYESKGKKAGALFTLNDGTQRRMNFGFCQENFWLLHDDGTKERLDVRKIKSLQVLGRPVR